MAGHVGVGAHWGSAATLFLEALPGALEFGPCVLSRDPGRSPVMQREELYPFGRQGSCILSEAVSLLLFLGEGGVLQFLGEGVSSNLVQMLTCGTC